MDSTCDFCLEIHKSENSTFHRLYGELLPDRILFENEHFICIPTIGQIIEGSLLILPKEHLFALASMPRVHVDAFQELLAKANALFTQSIVFEHGCWPKEGHNCGVYHAHAHVVPILTPFIPNELLKDPVACSDLNSCFKYLNGKTEYALYVDLDGIPYYMLPNANNTETFESQYFRRWLVSRFRPEKEFDWKGYLGIHEKELIDATVGFKVNEILEYTR